MITYPVDVANTTWAVLEIATGQIIRRNMQWPRSDGGEIQGADPAYAYLLHVAPTPPDYDSRLVQLVGTEVADAAANELRITWSTPKRPVAESVMAAENIETEKLEALVGQLTREVIETRLVLGAIIKYALKAQVYPAKVKTLVDDYETKAVKVWQNRDRLTQIKADLAAGNTPDLDAGWVA